MNKRGLLIAFEGIDGTGKTTQLRILAGVLAEMGHDVVVTREPTDGPFGRKIRSLFASRHQLTSEEELALFMDDRRDHVERLIKPALLQGRIVLTDRYYLSTAAYQGAAGYDPREIIAANEAFAPVPDLVLLMSLPPAAGVDRIMNMRGEALNDFEQEDSLARVAEIFEAMDLPCIRRIDASGTPEEVHARIMKEVGRTLTETHTETSV